MKGLIKYWLILCVLGGILFPFAGQAAQEKDTLYWNTNQNRVTADIRSTELLRVLEGISSATGWKVFVEPETFHRVSVKFKDLVPGEALHLLLGDVNFALIPETNASPRLFVFRTSLKMATQLVAPVKTADGGKSKIVPGELIVRLKPGVNIEDLARALGAKVIGRIDGLNAYRLKFEDQAAADTARGQLASNTDVTSVENNYSMEPPMTPRELASGAPPPPHLDLKPPPSTGKIIIGLADTALQPLGNGLDAFVLKQLSVAGEAQLDPSSPSHGTAMAETILRSLESVTKGSTSVQILPVDIYGPNTSTTTFDAAAGVALAVNSGATIINMSFGGEGESTLMQDLMKDGAAKGIVFLASAGNQPVVTPVYPAAYQPDVLAVTALDHGQLAAYANRGSFVTLAAPGTSAVFLNNQSYYVMGTSPAAAYASGVLAGYLDTTHATSAQGKAFLGTALGFKPGGK